MLGYLCHFFNEINVEVVLINISRNTEVLHFSPTADVFVTSAMLK